MSLGLVSGHTLQSYWEAACSHHNLIFRRYMGSISAGGPEWYCNIITFSSFNQPSTCNAFVGSSCLCYRSSANCRQYSCCRQQTVIVCSTSLSRGVPPAYGCGQSLANKKKMASLISWLIKLFFIVLIFAWFHVVAYLRQTLWLPYIFDSFFLLKNTFRTSQWNF